MKRLLVVSLICTLNVLVGFGQEGDADVHFNRAKLSYKMRKLDQSLEQCNKAIELDTGHYEALLLKGMIYYDKQDFDQAIHWSSESIRIYNRNGEAYFERGLMYYYLDQFDKAAADFIEASKIEIKRADYFYFKGLALKETGDLVEACKAWKRAEKLGIDEDVEKLRTENCGNVSKPEKGKDQEEEEEEGED